MAGAYRDLVTGRGAIYALLLALLLVVALTRGNGTNSTHSPSRTDEWGDPFVTDAQVGAVRVGMSDTEVFRLLDGEGSTGFYTNGPRGSTSVPGPTGLVLLYEYPVRSSDHRRPAWWRICLREGKVVGKRRVRHVELAVGCWG